MSISRTYTFCALLAMVTVSVSCTRDRDTRDNMSAGDSNSTRVVEEKTTSLTKGLLVKGPWRLWSDSFAVQPSDGYPITFNADGTLVSENLPEVSSWHINESGNLSLRGSSGQVLHIFTHELDFGILVYRFPPGPMQAASIVIGPPGRDGLVAWRVHTGRTTVVPVGR